MDLSAIKQLYKQGLAYARGKYSSYFFPANQALCDYQLDLVDKATTFDQIMYAIWQDNDVWTSAFNAPQPICSGCELQYTGIQFGVGHIGWYFLTGVGQNTSFNLSLFRVEIAPPAVVTADRSKAVGWLVLGGYGDNENWHSIQPEWIMLDYIQASYSTFVLSGAGRNIRVEFKSLQPMSFDVTVSFTDQTNQSRQLQAFLRSNTPPMANFPQACACAHGLGSLYYSYTDMSMVMITDKSEDTGRGWIDHQLIKSGIVKGFYPQAVQTVGRVLSKSLTDGWLWIAIQDGQSGLQYMFIHFFGRQFYQNAIRLNENIPMQVINVYKKGVPYFFPTDPAMDWRDLRVMMTKTVRIDSLGVDLPSEYNITLPGGKKVVLAIATAPNVYPVASASYETPARLFDLAGNIIGAGLIEANHYFTNAVMAQRTVQQAGGTPAQVPLLLSQLNHDQTGGRKFVAFLIVLLPLWAIIAATIFVLHRRDERQNRFGLAVAILIILYGLVVLN